MCSISHKNTSFETNHLQVFENHMGDFKIVSPTAFLTFSYMVIHWKWNDPFQWNNHTIFICSRETFVAYNREENRSLGADRCVSMYLCVCVCVFFSTFPQGSKLLRIDVTQRWPIALLHLFYWQRLRSLNKKIYIHHTDPLRVEMITSPIDNDYVGDTQKAIKVWGQTHTWAHSQRQRYITIGRVMVSCIKRTKKYIMTSVNLLLLALNDPKI